MVRRTASSGSSGEFPATSSNNSRIRFRLPCRQWYVYEQDYDSRRLQIKRAGDGKVPCSAYWFCWPVSALSTAEAGFRSPESLVRNVYAYYGDRSSELSSGLPRDSATARQFFDPVLQRAWSCPQKNEPYDFLVQSPTWKLGAVSISILRKQFDKTYVAVAFTTTAAPSR